MRSPVRARGARDRIGRPRGGCGWSGVSMSETRRMAVSSRGHRSDGSSTTQRRTRARSVHEGQDQSIPDCRRFGRGVGSARGPQRGRLDHGRRHPDPVRENACRRLDAAWSEQGRGGRAREIALACFSLGDDAEHNADQYLLAAARSGEELSGSSRGARRRTRHRHGVRRGVRGCTTATD